MLVGPMNEPFHQIGIFLGMAALFVLVAIMPARILQKRHGYPGYLVLLAFIPYVGPLAVIWGFAVATPKSGEMETV
ncbi:hypothetical protein [Tateyamaria sp. syn59]|uniref:hypothetical protein n=1 Tax=Tateyamaria sp. syn59 TaxID=2576942 RepID=UPI001CB9B207|nr:hypothetical protein [Tateyamaria sp. syn59]